MVIIAGVGFLLVPALASGAGEEVITLFRDDFESGDNPWWYTKGLGTADVRDGYLFLNLGGTDEVSFAKLDGSRLSKFARWQYAGFEVRLRCIGDLEGMRSWGLSDFLVSQNLVAHGDDDPLSGYRVLLNHIQPEYTSPSWAGFQAQVTKVSAYHFAPDRLNAFFNESLSGFDMTEWHTYTILYENGERKFLIDGEEVASTSIVPIGIMGVEI